MKTAIDRDRVPEVETDLLVERARRREPDAFEALYAAEHRRVYALALRLTCDGHAAEELTQDVFVRAWRSLPTFRGECRLSTWLHAIAIRSYAQRMRSARAWDGRKSAQRIEAYAFTARRAMPDTRVDLERALAGLPARAREVAVLHDVYGYKHREIAGLLGIAEGTAKAQLHRARHLLRAALEGEPEGTSGGRE